MIENFMRQYNVNNNNLDVHLDIILLACINTKCRKGQCSIPGEVTS